MIYLLSPVPKEGTIHLPMISFSLLDTSLDFASCDTLMFTSKQAVKSAEALNPEWKNIPSLAIGASTAKQIEKLGGNVLYQPKSFYGKTLSQEIITNFKSLNIMYIRPKIVSFDSKKFLEKAGIKIEERIIYETMCQCYSQKEKPKKGAIIIFTSPSTIHCFLKNFSWDFSYTAVVIGESTKIHLPKNASYVVADLPLIDACITKAKEILLSSNTK
jgi:uroporphyrinogen-III synthase